MRKKIDRNGITIILSGLLPSLTFFYLGVSNGINIYLAYILSIVVFLATLIYGKRIVK